MSKVLQMYVSSACLNGHTDIVDRVQRLYHAGVRRIELGSGSSTGPSFVEQLRSYPCHYLVHNYFPPPDESFVLNLASADRAIRKRSLDLVQRAIELCVELEAPFYSVHAGFITDPYAFSGTHYLFPAPTGSDARQRAFDRFVSSLLAVDEFAREHQVGLLVENNVCPPDLGGKLLLQTPDEFVEFFEVVRSPNLGVLLDFGHLNVSARTLGFNRLDFIDRLAPYVRAFHVHDNDGIDDTHQPPQPRSWIFDVLRRPEFAGLPMVVEAKFETTSDLRRYVDWFKMELERG